MAEANGNPPGLFALVNRLARTGVEVLRNRGELFALEIQEEKARAAELLFYVCAAVLSGFIGMVTLTLLILYVVPEGAKVYAAIGFVVLYFAGALVAGLALKAALRRPPFPESLRQLQKDRQWLESLK